MLNGKDVRAALRLALMAQPKGGERERETNQAGNAEEKKEKATWFCEHKSTCQPLVSGFSDFVTGD